MATQSEKSLYERLTIHFQACLDLPEPERRKYVSKLAVSHPELERELSALLRFHQEDAAPTAPSPPSATEQPARESTRTRRTPAWRSIPVLILLVGAVSLAIILGVQVWALTRLETDLKGHMASNLKGAVDLRVSNLRSWVAAQKRQAEKILAAHVAALRESAPEGLDREALRARLLAHPSFPIVSALMLHAPPEIADRGFAVLSASGVDLANDFEPLVGNTVASSAADYLGRVSMGDTVVCHPYPDRKFTGKMTPEPRNPVMFVAGPIRDASGRVIAMGTFRFSPTRLYEILGGANAEFVAFDAQGLVLNNLRDGKELQALGLTPAPETALSAYLRDPGIELASGRRPDTPPDSWPPTLMCRSAARGQDGMDASGHRDWRGRRVTAAWAWIPELEMGVGGQMPLDKVLEPMGPVRTAFNTLVGIFAFLTAGLFASTRFLRIRRRTPSESPFGAYVVERSLGKGGTAEVFLARHAFLKRPAALKILSEPHPDGASVERFEREARLACSLAHPNTIQVFDFGETPDGKLYYAMEYVEGVTLAQLVTLAGPPPVGRAVYLLRQIAGSLAEAHHRGILHRDLKPSNIMISARGGLADIVKVLDFGIACSLTPGDSDFTRSTSLIGTPAFLAPERIRSPQAMDRRSDLYAFGAVAFHLLTGRNVFEATSLTELLYQVLTSPRPSPSRLRGETIPPALEKLVLDCLSADPEERPSDVREIAAVLDAVGRLEDWTPEQALEWWTAHQDQAAAFVRASG